MRPLRHLEPIQHAIRRFRKRRATTGVVLMYHRILPPGVDAWRLNVSPRNFAEQLDVLRSKTRPVSLRSMAADVRSASVAARSVAVTFDDGYVNNLELGLPVLEKFDVPATVFVATGYTSSRREFWWDELEQLLVHERALPSRLTLAVGTWQREWELGSAADAGHDLSGTAPAAKPGSRLWAYHDIWLALRTLSDDARREALRQIGDWCGESATLRPSYRAMTPDEVASMAAHPLIEIGAHTVTHPWLTELPAPAQRQEILNSRGALETWLGAPVTSFSYPFGGWSPSMRTLLQKEGFEFATAVDEQTAWHRSHPFSIPRFMVEDWDGAEFERRLTHWWSEA